MKYVQDYHVLPVLAPADITTNNTNTQFVNVSGALWVEWHCMIGNIAGDTYDFTVEACTSNATSGGATEITVPFSYRLSSAVGTDTMGAVTACSSAAAAPVAAGDDNKLLILSLNPADLDEGYNYARVHIAYNSGTNCVVGVNALMLPVYASQSMLSAT